MARNLFLPVLLLLLLTAAFGVAAPPTAAPGWSRPGGDLPSIVPPGSTLPQLQLFLPKTLYINGFEINNVTYAGGSTLKNATGMGQGWLAAKTNTFDLSFANVEIEPIQDIFNTTPSKGKIVKGTITRVFSPPYQFTHGTIGVQVKRLFLAPNDTRIDLAVPLPTLWSREKGPAPDEYLPAKNAVLTIENYQITQELDLFIQAYTAHKLGEVGIGDTGIIMACANKPLLVDLSTKQPANNNPQLTGVGFTDIMTVPQPDKNNTNIGFCYARYLTNGAVANVGFWGQMTYQSSTPWSYTTSVPQGYQISLSKGTLNLANSAVANGVFFGNIQLPASVTTQAGTRIGCGFSSFAVDVNLDMKGLLPYKEQIHWGRPAGQGQTPGPSSYYLQSEQPAFVFFPGAAGEKIDRTKTDPATQEEKFVNVFDTEIDKVPGVTFASFNLGILTSDANNKPIELAFEALGVGAANLGNTKGVFRPLNMPKYGNHWWLNIGQAGVSGLMEIESALGRHDLPVALGYVGHVAPNMVTFNKLFKGFLHAKKTAYESAFSNDNMREFGHFFQASFVDGAVFDLGMDGHFEVDGPSEIKPDLYDLAATSTADLTSARVEADAELKYWGVNLKTSDSRIVPRASRVFFLGAQIWEKAHYTQYFPVVWGEMDPPGDIPVLLFGYGTPQYFDGIPYSYTHVELTKWPGAYPPDTQPWGALAARGDLSVPFFGAQNMLIYDHKFLAAPADWEKKKIVIDVDGKDYFSYLDRQWGGGKGSFTFKTVRYHDGPESEDGFRGDGYVRISDFKLPPDQGLTGSIAITSLETLIGVEHHGIVQFASEDDAAPDYNKLQLSEVKGETHITSDEVSALELDATFDKGKSEMMGGLENPKYKTTFRPDLTVFDATGDFAMTFAPAVMLTGQDVHLNVTLSRGNFYGRLDVEKLVFIAGNVSGFGGGGFGIIMGPVSKVLQGYGTVTINGVPWPLPNSGGGALVLAFGAQPADLYALDYISISKIQSFLPPLVTGFYLACKVGYNYDFAGLGSAWIYFTGGAGLLLPEVVFHSGLTGGVEICGIGLESGAEIGAHGNMVNPMLSLFGTLHYELSLLFFDFSWTQTIELRPDGIRVASASSGAQGHADDGPDADAASAAASSAEAQEMH